MHFSTLTAALMVLLSAAHGWDTTTTTSAPASITSPNYSTGTCPTVTQTGGSGCPTPPSRCTVEECITEVLVTQPCTCLEGLPTATFCETTCHQGCQTTTSVLRIPCATSPPSSSPTSSSTSSSSCTDTSCLSSSAFSSSTSSSSTCTDASCTISSTSSSSSSTLSYSTSQSSSPTSSPTGSPTSTPYYSNSTVTVTSITTLTTCPYDNKCHGQTSTWTGSGGPFSCSATLTCTCVLPGGKSSTITGPTTTIEVTTVGPSSTSSGTSSAKSTSTGALQSSWGERKVADGWVGMIIAGLLGLL